jgi:hypothetical protein
MKVLQKEITDNETSFCTNFVAKANLVTCFNSLSCMCEGVSTQTLAQAFFYEYMYILLGASMEQKVEEEHCARAYVDILSYVDRRSLSFAMGSSMVCRPS